MALMPENDEKTVVHVFFQDKKLPFTNNVKDNITSPGEFLSPRYDIDIFKLDIKFAVEMQVYMQDFKQKRDKANSFRYFFRLVGIYKLEDMKLLLMSTPEKK